MRIKIPDRNAFATDCQRVVGSDGNGVQIAEAHRLGRSRVMAWWAHQRESFLLAEGQIDCTDGRSGGTPGVYRRQNRPVAVTAPDVLGDVPAKPPLRWRVVVSSRPNRGACLKGKLPC